MTVPEPSSIAIDAARNNASCRIILKLEQTRLADGTIQTIRGAGVDARTDANTREQNES